MAAIMHFEKTIETLESLKLGNKEMNEKEMSFYPRVDFPD